MSSPDSDRKRKYDGPDAPPDASERPDDAQPPPPGPVTESSNGASSSKKSRVDEEDEVSVPSEQLLQTVPVSRAVPWYNATPCGAEVAQWATETGDGSVAAPTS